MSQQQVVKTETLTTGITQPDHTQETLSFATTAIQNMKDGDRVMIEYTQNGTKTNRIELFKGITKKDTQTNFTPSLTVQIGQLLDSWWVCGALTLLSVPMMIGCAHIGVFAGSRLRAFRKQ